MKLYDLPYGEIFYLKDHPQIPPESRNPVTLDIPFLLNNIYGMYSHCVDTDGNVYHFAAWTEVIPAGKLPL